MAIKAYFKMILMPALLAIMLALEADATVLESGSSQSLRAEAHGSVALMAKMAAQIEKLEKKVKQLQSQVKHQAATMVISSASGPGDVELGCTTTSATSCTCMTKKDRCKAYCTDKLAGFGSVDEDGFKTCVTDCKKKAVAANKAAKADNVDLSTVDLPDDKEDEDGGSQ